MHALQGATERLLLVQSNPDFEVSLTEHLSQLGFFVRDACGLEEAVRAAGSESVYPVILVSPCRGRFAASDREWLDLVAELQRASSLSQIILLIPPEIDVATCCDAVDAGVTGFVEFDAGRFDHDLLERRIREALRRFQRAAERADSFLAGDAGDKTGIVAQSASMRDVLMQAGHAAEVSDAPVLILGESGTGKQLLAQLIHRLDGKRGSRPMITVNCATFTGTLAESALFGHEKGSFTGATERRLGYFRSADGGTIFLDEIGELELALQPKLLRVLQEGLFRPVGSDQEVSVDVRVLAATNRHLPELIEQGRFRLDLYQRLNVISLEIPPLRERPEDIQALTDHLVQKYSASNGRTAPSVNRRVLELLRACRFDGNVRELENTIRRVLALNPTGEEIQLSDLPAHLRNQIARNTCKPIVSHDVINQVCKLIESGGITLPEFIEACERHVLAASIRRSGESADKLAQRLGYSRRTFYNKRRKYGV